MKNILVRGGIEFLAVFLGIALSLWVNDWQENREIQKRLVEDYKKIHMEVKTDIDNIENILGLNEKIIQTEEYLLAIINSETDFNYDTVIQNIFQVISPTFFGNQSAYSASVASGRFNTSKDDELISKISNLYEHYYKRLVLNGDLLDQRSTVFGKEHSFIFYRPLYKQTNIDTSAIKEYFLSHEFHNGLLRFHDFRKRFYLLRLRDTKNQMIKVDSILTGYFSNNK